MSDCVVISGSRVKWQGAHLSTHTNTHKGRKKGRNTRRNRVTSNSTFNTHTLRQRHALGWLRRKGRHAGRVVAARHLGGRQHRRGRRVKGRTYLCEGRHAHEGMSVRSRRGADLARNHYHTCTSTKNTAQRDNAHPHTRTKDSHTHSTTCKQVHRTQTHTNKTHLRQEPLHWGRRLAA